MHRASNDLAYENQQGGKISFYENDVFFADSSFFKFFSYELVKGNHNWVLKEPNSMVLTESSANKYFGTEDPIGKTVTLGNVVYEITGVVKDLPENTHLKFDVLISLVTWELHNPRPFEPATGLNYNGFFTYLMLDQGVNKGEFETEVAAYLLPILKREDCEVKTQLIQDIHLKSAGIKMDMAVIGDHDAVNYLFFAACLILVLAWTNHINLIVYQNSQRIKEFGIKKSFGANTVYLAKQIILESLFIEVVALVLAVVIYVFVTSYFESLFFTKLKTESFLDILFTSKAMITFFVMMISGVFMSFYVPSIVVAKSQIIPSLENKIEIVKGLTFRKSILTFQYVIIIVISIISLGIYKQIGFLSNKDYGIETENTLILQGPKMPRDSSRIQPFYSFKSVVLKNNNRVKSISLSSDIPGKNILRKGNIAKLGKEMDKSIMYNFLFVGDEYVSSYNHSILAGHDFPKNSTANDKVIINESALFALGYSNADDAIQQDIITSWEAKVTIIAVINDYHHLSPKSNYEPIILLPLSVGLPSRIHYTIKLESPNQGNNNYDILLSDINERWNTYFPNSAFNYYFLEDSYQEQLESESNFQELLFFLTTVSIILTCLGILGLSSLLAAQKRREIAIRKILGAASLNVYLRSLGGVIQVLVISCILSIPIAFIGLSRWLNNYASKIEIAIWIFLIPLIFVLILTVVIASFHVLRAALSNPTNVLAHQ